MDRPRLTRINTEKFRLNLALFDLPSSSIMPVQLKQSDRDKIVYTHFFVMKLFNSIAVCSKSRHRLNLIFSLWYNGVEDCEKFVQDDFDKRLRLSLRFFFLPCLFLFYEKWPTTPNWDALNYSDSLRNLANLPLQLVALRCNPLLSREVCLSYLFVRIWNRLESVSRASNRLRMKM